MIWAALVWHSEPGEHSLGFFCHFLSSRDSQRRKHKWSTYLEIGVCLQFIIFCKCYKVTWICPKWSMWLAGLLLRSGNLNVAEFTSLTDPQDSSWKSHICYFLSEMRNKDFHMKVLNYKILACVFKQHQQPLKTWLGPNQIQSVTLQPTGCQFATCVP